MMFTLSAGINCIFLHPNTSKIIWFTERPIVVVVPIYTRFLDPSISASQSISRYIEGHVDSVQPIKCMLFILICNKQGQ